MKSRRFWTTVGAACILVAQVGRAHGLPQQDPAASKPSAKPPSSNQAGREQDVLADPQRDESPEVKIRLPTARQGRYRFELGVLPRYNSNLFEATGGAPRQVDFITTLSAKFGADLFRRGTTALTSEFQFRRHTYDRVNQADSSNFDVALGYESGRSRLELTYFSTPRRLAFISGTQNVFNSVNGVEVEYSRPLTRRSRVRGSYEFAREIYSVLKDRDAGRNKFSADVRYRVHQALVPGIGFEWERVDAQSENFARRGAALVLLLNSQIKDVAWMSIRYRYTERDYTSIDPTAGNSGRNDRRHDIRFYSNIKLTKRWSLFVYNSYTNNRSTRARRTFTGDELGIGTFFRFP
ncbi:MAG: DUF560 domain-containing protein [Acidobacteria bacterium]|nr:DUF560 domain-containing protein [Acidobacteriota bacterium]